MRLANFIKRSLPMSWRVITPQLMDRSVRPPLLRIGTLGEPQNWLRDMRFHLLRVAVVILLLLGPAGLSAQTVIGGAWEFGIRGGYIALYGGQFSGIKNSMSAEAFVGYHVHPRVVVSTGIAVSSHGVHQPRFTFQYIRGPRRRIRAFVESRLQLGPTPLPVTPIVGLQLGHTSSDFIVGRRGWDVGGLLGFRHQLTTKMAVEVAAIYSRIFMYRSDRDSVGRWGATMAWQAGVVVHP